MQTNRRPIATAILFVILFLFPVAWLPAQTVSISAKQRPLAEVLQTISANYQVKIAYDSDLAKEIIVSVTVSQRTPLEAVEQALISTNLEAIQMGDVIVVRPKAEKSQPIPVASPLPKIFKILGVVKALGSKEQLPYAVISILGTDIGITCNSDGYFSITTQRTDTLRLKAFYLGFNPTEINVFPPSHSSIVLVEMERQELVIEDVLVRVKQPDLVLTENNPGMVAWNSNRNTDIPSLNGLDIAAPLQLLPGVDGTTESSAGLLVRKSATDKNLITYDGFTIYQIDHFFGAFSSLNAKAIKDIRVHKGGFDARWGGRASSVVEITGKTGNANVTRVDAGVDMLNFDATVEGPLGPKFTYVIAARRSFSDLYRSSLYYSLMESARSDIFTLTSTSPSFFKVDIDEPSYTFGDISLKLAYRPTEKDNISVSAYRGFDATNLERIQSFSTLTEKANWGNGGVGLRWAQQWSPILYQTINVGLSKYSLQFNHADSTLRRRQSSTLRDTIIRALITDNSITDFNANWHCGVKIGKWAEAQMGIQTNGVRIHLYDSMAHYTNNFEVIDTARVSNQGMLQSTLWGKFAWARGKLSSFKLGLRANHYSVTQKMYWEPRIQAAFAFNRNFTLRASAGRYYQFVNRTLDVSQSGFRNVWNIADGYQYPVVHSDQIMGGFLIRFWGLTFDAEAYYKSTSNLGLNQTVLKRVGGRIKQEKRIITYGNKASGIDVLVRKEFQTTHIWASYSLTRSMNRSDFFNWGESYPAADDQLHELKMACVGKWRKCGYNAVWIYGSGEPWDEPLFTTNMNLSPNYAKNSNRLPQYHRLDLGFNYTLLTKETEIKLGINFFNVYNHINTLATLYNLSHTPLQTFLQTGTPLEYSNFFGLGFNWSVYLNVKF